MSAPADPSIAPAALPVAGAEEKTETPVEAALESKSAVEGADAPKSSKTIEVAGPHGLDPAAASAAVQNKKPLEEQLAAINLDKPEFAPGDEPKSASSKVPKTATTAQQNIENDEVKSEEPKPALTPLAELFQALPSIIAECQYTEMWGVELTNSKHVPTSIVLEKFLRANKMNVVDAKKQLAAALKWRKTVQPGQLADFEFDAEKYGGLGYVTVYPKTDTHEKEIVTWNIYGAVKDAKKTFGDIDAFVRWRAALMELSLKELNLAAATVPIPADGEDQYRMVQVHDHLQVSFLRMNPVIKAASKETIMVFATAYPELLKEKFFVNVPVLMGWVFSAMKLFLAPETVKKFHPLAYGSALAGELPTFGAELPTRYGGKGEDIEKGLTVKYKVPGAATVAAHVDSESTSDDDDVTPPAAVEKPQVVASPKPVASSKAVASEEDTSVD